MLCLTGSIHEALQLRAHSLHPLHRDVSKRGLYNEYLENIPSSVPTGHMVLQYVLPFLHARIAIIMKVTAATINVPMLFIHISTV